MASTNQQKLFHITIGTAPQGELKLHSDLRMVKAAILYGDRVKLCSTAYSILLPTIELKDKSLEEQFDYFERIIPNTDLSEDDRAIALENVRRDKESLQSEGSINKMFARLRIKREMGEKWDRLVRNNSPLGQELAAKEFKRAIKENLLEIHTFKTLEDAAITNKAIYTKDDALNLTREFIDIVGATVSDGSTYPLFDESIGVEVQKRLQQEAVSVPKTRIAQVKQIRLAADMLERLPLLDEAPIDEIIDIRRELHNPLIRFRTGIMEYADKIKNAAWDKDFSVEAEQLFRREIEPAILEIEDAVKANKSLAMMSVHKLKEHPLLSGGSILSLTLSSLGALPTLASLALALPSAVQAADAIYEAYKEHQQQQQSVEKNQLYFYYRAKKLLS